MREILFRGKTVLNEQWVEGSLIVENDGTCYIFHYDKSGISGSDYVKPETVGQYTGLKDKNGVLIFEGDVVDIKREGCDGEQEWIERVLIEDIRRLPRLGGSSLISREIVGNLTDNPELVEGQR